MKIVKLKGGLGNQMFQYAFAKLIEQKTGDEVKLDLTSYKDLKEDLIRRPRILRFKISLPIATEEDIKKVCKFEHSGNSKSYKYRIGLILESILNKKYYFEINRAYRDLNNLVNASYFDGYWQSYRYVDEVIGKLDKEFSLLDALDNKSLKMMKKIEETQSVFVGIRRGDYLLVKPKHYGVLDEEYYKKAMNYIANKISNAVFFIFSNDINWVQKNFDFKDFNVIFITETVDDFEDFILMTKCKHSIIANSTYHWWGAYRHDYAGKIVVAPKKWFADNAPIDIIPDRWIKM